MHRHRCKHAYISQASAEDPALADLQTLMQEVEATAEKVQDVRPLLHRLRGAIDTIVEDGVDREKPVMKQADALVDSLDKKQVTPNIVTP